MEGFKVGATPGSSSGTALAPPSAQEPPPMPYSRRVPVAPHDGRTSERHAVIVGGGFAGLHAALDLDDTALRVTLLDRHNYHLFQPLLYQVATAGLSPGDIAQPIRHILTGSPNITVLLGSVTGVDVRGRRVLLQDGELAYDFLVLAAGSTHSYFGHEDWKSLAPGLKDIDDAVEIRRRVLLAFEAA